MTAIVLPEREMLVLSSKFAAVGAVLATLWESVGTVGQGIILIAAVFAALGYLYAKLVKPVAGAFKRTYDAVESLEQLPALVTRVDAIEQELRVARTDRGDIKTALESERGR